jgi:Fe-S-cluster-containing hydrogenase component 2
LRDDRDRQERALSHNVCCVWNCGVCGCVCPAGAIKRGQGGVTIDLGLCQGCLQCIRVCPAGAIGEKDLA